MPDRLADTKNVRNFGAVGNGSTDDWDAIQKAVDWTANNGRGTIYFPPGTYRVSKPIVIEGALENFRLVGEHGSSVIVGAFNDFVIRRGVAGTQGTSGGHIIERLAVQNNHPTGGGIRLGNCVGGIIKDCIVTANIGISAAASALANK
jgi:hypothetical protein